MQVRGRRLYGSVHGFHVGKFGREDEEDMSRTVDDGAAEEQPGRDGYETHAGMMELAIMEADLLMEDDP